MLDAVAAVLTYVFIGLLVISAGAYVVALFILGVRRRVPEEIAPARVGSFLALVLCAAKAIVGQNVAAFQPALTALIVIACGVAVWNLLRVLFASGKLPPAARTVLRRWIVVIVPPIISIGLLGIYDTLPEYDRSTLIKAFMVVNGIPALYVLTNARSLLGFRRAA